MTILPQPSTATNLQPNLNCWKHAYDYVDSLMNTFGSQSSEDDSNQTIRSILLRDGQDRYHAWLLAIILPWASIPAEEYAKPGTKAGLPLPAMVAKEGIKATNKVCEIIASACNNMKEIESLQRKVVTQTKDPDSLDNKDEYVGRDTLGMAIRRWGPTWRSQVFLALLLDIAPEEPDELSNGKPCSPPNIYSS